jgi:hypothetical protein
MEAEVATTFSFACSLMCSVQARQHMMNTMADEMNYGAMGGYVGGGLDGGEQPTRFRGDSDDER